MEKLKINHAAVWVSIVLKFIFVFLSHMIGGFFSQAPYALALINGGHDMAALTISGAVLGAWRKY